MFFRHLFFIIVYGYTAINDRIYEVALCVLNQIFVHPFRRGVMFYGIYLGNTVNMYLVYPSCFKGEQICKDVQATLLLQKIWVLLYR